MLLLSILLFAPLSAIAGFHSNRGDWDDLDSFQKDGYIAGVLDVHLMQLANGYENGHNERAAQQEECLFDLGIDTRDLTKLVDEAYQDIEKWDWPPAAIVMRVVYELCKDR